jgi:hypothetical protein
MTVCTMTSVNTTVSASQLTNCYSSKNLERRHAPQSNTAIPFVATFRGRGNVHNTEHYYVSSGCSRRRHAYKAHAIVDHRCHCQTQPRLPVYQSNLPTKTPIWSNPSESGAWIARQSVQATTDCSANERTTSQPHIRATQWRTIPFITLP